MKEHTHNKSQKKNLNKDFDRKFNKLSESFHFCILHDLL